MNIASRFLGTLLIVAAGFAFSGTAVAQFQWRFEQIYSNPSGLIQFVVVYDQSGNANNQDAIKGIDFVSVSDNLEHGHDPGYAQDFSLPNNLPNAQTAGKRFLIATEGFASLNLIKPDYIVTNQFIPQLAGTLALNSGRDVIDIVAWPQTAALPADGVNARYRDGSVKANLAVNFAGQSASVPAGATPTAPTSFPVVEYYNASLDHYFITWVGDEISKLDAGVELKGWTRTGQTFKTYPTVQTGTSPVCRYYIPPGLGDSHFFGRGSAECTATGQKNPSFVLEDPAFMQMYLPVAGICPPSTIEIYRVFSNRVDANHRYMTDKTIRDQMVAKGWLAEGDGPNLVVMCAPQ